MLALLLLAFVALAGAGGWGLLRIGWAPPRPTVACEAVIDGTLTVATLLFAWEVACVVLQSRILVAGPELPDPPSAAAERGLGR